MGIKLLLAYTLLELCKTKKLEDISVTDIHTAAGVSRRTFYNHFQDKYELIIYVYDQFVSAPITKYFHDPSYRKRFSAILDQYEKYKKFMKNACRMKEQNNLSDYMINLCKKTDYAMYCVQFGSRELPPHYKWAIEYTTAGTMDLTIAWITDDLTITKNELLDIICQMNDACLTPLLYSDDASKSPYRLPPQEDK